MGDALNIFKSVLGHVQLLMSSWCGKWIQNCKTGTCTDFLHVIETQLVVKLGERVLLTFSSH